MSGKANQRLRTDAGMNMHLVSRTDCDGAFPAIPRCDCVPDDLMAFNLAMSTKDSAKAGAGCHFFLDDYQFERVWGRPEAYVNSLLGFKCVLSPDFSMYTDMPLPMLAWNHYRKQAVGLWWSRLGMEVVPTLSWAMPDSYRFCFDGVPSESVVAVSTMGAGQSERSDELWRMGMTEALRRLRPSCVLVYGRDVGFDFGNVPHVFYGNKMIERFEDGRKRKLVGGGSG